MSESVPAAEQAAAALAELLEVASLMVTSFVWSPEALPLAERLAAAVNRVTAVTEGRRDDAEHGAGATCGEAIPAGPETEASAACAEATRERRRA